MLEKVFISLLFVVLLSHVAYTQNSHSRQRRFLVVPPTSPTRHQLISGIGIPLQLEYEAITLGWALKAQYFLPETVNQLKWIYFPDVFGNYTPTNYAETQWHLFPNGRRRREIAVDKMTGQTYEKYVGDVQEIGNQPLKNVDDEERDFYDNTFDDQFPKDDKIPIKENFPKAKQEELIDTSGTRWLMYDGLGRLLSSKGMPGRHCVLRGICEAAETKFTHYSGIFGELMHIIFTPSSSHDLIFNKDHFDYIKAEQLGEEGQPCDQIFHECKSSLLDIFTEVYESPMFKFF